MSITSEETYMICQKRSIFPKRDLHMVSYVYRHTKHTHTNDKREMCIRKDTCQKHFESLVVVHEGMLNMLIYIYIYIHIQTTKERYEYEKTSVKMISGLFLYSMQGYRICQLYFVCQCIHIHTHTHTHAHTHTHKHAHACTYKRTHTHINTHIHTNARVCEETDSVRTHILQYSLTKSTITCLFSRSHLKQRACECATYKFS